MIFSLRSDEGGVAALENFCVIPAQEMRLPTGREVSQTLDNHPGNRISVLSDALQTVCKGMKICLLSKLPVDRHWPTVLFVSVKAESQ